MSRLFKNIDRKNTSCCKWDLSEESNGIKKENLHSFWIADSDYETCPKVKKDIIKRAKHGIYGYSIVCDEYYSILNKWVYDHYGYNVGKDNTIITSGVVNALNYIVKLFTNHLDNVVVNPPVYNPFYDCIKNNNCYILRSDLKRIEIDDNLFTYKIDFSDLEEKIKQAKMYILCNPQNPVGRCYTYEEIKTIVSLCKKYNTILVSDEIHCDLIMNGHVFTSAGKFFNEYDNIIVCTAPSKTFNIAGLGCSNIFFANKKMYEVFNSEYSKLNIIHNMFGTIACMSCYKYGSTWAEKQNKHIYDLSKIVYDFVRKYNLKASILEATYLMWIDLSSLKLSQNDLINGLIKHNLWFNSGTIYDEESIGLIRINIACGKENLKTGLKELAKFIESVK